MKLLFALSAVVGLCAGFSVGARAAPELVVTGCASTEMDPVRRPKATPPRCETCKNGTKICCPDCSVWVNKSCVCDCASKACECR